MEACDKGGEMTCVSVCIYECVCVCLCVCVFNWCCEACCKLHAEPPEKCECISIQYRTSYLMLFLSFIRSGPEWANFSYVSGVCMPKLEAYMNNMDTLL